MQIHLQHTADGIVARVIADHAAAAQTLAQNGDDLRRSLQSHGVTLLRLDIESSDDRATAGAEDRAGQATARRPRARRRRRGRRRAPTASAATDTTTSAHDLGGTALVNVLA